MAEETKKGFFSSLFASKKGKGCCCGVRFEEVPRDEDTEKAPVDQALADHKPESGQQEKSKIKN